MEKREKKAVTKSMSIFVGYKQLKTPKVSSALSIPQSVFLHIRGPTKNNTYLIKPLLCSLFLLTSTTIRVELKPYILSDAPF